MIKQILIYPDKRLRQENEPIADFGQSVQDLYRDLRDTLQAVGGAGLSACQVGINKRMFIVKVDYDEPGLEPACFINPEITFTFEENEIGEEGCLSFPGLYEEIFRSKWIKVKFQDLQGEEQEITANGFLAKVIQHECEHLQGKLFIDHMTTTARNQAKKHFTALKMSGQKRR